MSLCDQAAQGKLERDTSTLLAELVGRSRHWAKIEAFRMLRHMELMVS